MKTQNVISVCLTDCDSKVVVPVKRTKNGKVVIEMVTTYHKVTRKGWGMTVEITTLPSGKKTSVTRHGPISK